MRKKGMYVLFFVVFLLSVSAVSAQNFLEDILEPFADINVAQTYQNYALFVDFVLYLIIFISITRTALGKRFTGSGGTALQGALGVAFAIAMIVWESNTDWSIGKLGPFVALVFTLVCGVALFNILRNTGARASGAGALAFVIVYLGMRAMAPEVFIWVREKIPILDLLLGIAMIIALFKGIAWAVNAFRGGAGGLQGLDKTLAAASTPIGKGKLMGKLLPETAAARKEAKEERAFANAIASVGRKELKDLRNTINAINNLIWLVTTYKEHPENLKRISEKIGEISSHENVEAQMQNKIKKMERHLLRIEKEELPNLEKALRDAETAAANAPPEQKAKLEKEAHELKREVDETRVNLEQVTGAIKSLLARFAEEEGEFIGAMQAAVTNLNAGHVEGAVSALRSALSVKEKQLSLMERFEKMDIREIRRYMVEQGHIAHVEREEKST